MSCTRSAEPAAEAKKAEGASRVALRTPKPPHLTGSDAWDEAESVRLMFRMLLRSDLSRESKTCSSGAKKHGEMRKVYKSLGRAKGCLKRLNASCACRC